MQKQISIEQIQNLKPIWRVLLLVAIAQISGGALGVLKSSHGDMFFDFWYGGVYSTPIGFVLGIIWQCISKPECIFENKAVLTFLAVASFILPLFAFFTPELGPIK